MLPQDKVRWEHLRKGVVQMESIVAKLYDYLSSDIPEELRRWHVTEEEVDEALTLLGREHAAQNPVEQAEVGDSLRCRDSEGRTVLLYPGRKLPGAEEAEQSAVGRRVGETFSCRLGETEAALTVEEILRLEPHPVDGALVRLAGIAGVDTPEEYRVWYVQENGPEKRLKAAQNIARQFWEAIQEHSELSIDQAERDRWCGVRGKMMYDMDVENGRDPHIPDEGTELLSDEEALAQYVDYQEQFYRDYVLFRHISYQDGYVYTREMCEKEMAEYKASHREQLEAMGYDVNRALTDDEFLMRSEHAYMEYAFGLLTRAAEKFLED